jgi:hypothetical protein
MELRRCAGVSAVADGVGFKALAWAELDDQCWELPLLVSMTGRARASIDESASASGRERAEGDLR